MYCSGKEAVRVAAIAREAGADGMPLAPPVGSAGITHFWEVEKYPEIWLDRIKAQLRVGDLPAITHPSGSSSPMFSLGLPLVATLGLDELLLDMMTHRTRPVPLKLLP